MELLDKIAWRFGLETKSILRKKLIQTELTLKDLEWKVVEADELSEICLNEKRNFEEKYKNLKQDIGSKYDKFVKLIAGLPKNKKELLWRLIPKKKSTKNSWEKISFDKDHSYPQGFEKFLTKLSFCEYLDEIKAGGLSRQYSKTSFYGLEKENGFYTIKGIYVKSNVGEHVYLHTTVKTEDEAFFIKIMLNHEFR